MRHVNTLAATLHLGGFDRAIYCRAVVLVVLMVLHAAVEEISMFGDGSFNLCALITY